MRLCVTRPTIVSPCVTWRTSTPLASTQVQSILNDHDTFKVSPPFFQLVLFILSQIRGRFAIFWIGQHNSQFRYLIYHSSIFEIMYFSYWGKIGWKNIGKDILL